jgi:MSHA biogenesis protein MshN
MSVLNRMLDDLAARGAAPAAPGPVAAGVGRAQTDGAARRRPFVFWGVILAATLTVFGSLAWLEHRARQVTLSGAPLGAESFGAAVAAAQAEPATPSDARPAAAVSPPGQTALASADDAVAANGSAPGAAAPSIPGASAPQARADLPAHAGGATAAGPAQVRNRAGVGPDTRAAIDAAADAPVIRRSSQSPGPADLAYARAAELIARGRSHEAIGQLRALLGSHPLHGDARAALATLLAEAGDRPQALAILLDGVALDAPRFAPAAAQLQHAAGDTAAALDTLERIAPAQRTAEHMALLGGLAYRAGRYPLAVDAYEKAVGQRGAQPLWWLGLGLAQEAHGRPAEAHASYSRLAGAVALTPELRAYLVQRLAATAAQAQARPAQPPAPAPSLTTAGP